MKQLAERAAWSVIFVALFLAWADGGGVISSKATAAVYVNEKGTPVPSAVATALNTLNRQGIVATIFDPDTTDGTGETPEQYKAALAAAKEAGLPALVVMAGASVARTVKTPTTEAQVLEAVE